MALAPIGEDSERLKIESFGDKKMECGRLNRLVRTWYVQVQEETLAPARMVEFMEKHLENCDDCLADPDVLFEVKKITEIVLPPSKMTKTGKPAGEDEDAVPNPAASDEAESTDESDGSNDDEDDDSNVDDDVIEPDLADNGL